VNLVNQNRAKYHRYASRKDLESLKSGDLEMMLSGLSGKTLAMDAFIDETGKIIPTLIQQTELACNYGHLGYQNHALCRNKSSITNDSAELIVNKDSDKVPVTFNDDFSGEYNNLIGSSGSGDGYITAFVDVVTESADDETISEEENIAKLICLVLGAVVLMVIGILFLICLVRKCRKRRGKVDLEMTRKYYKL